MHTSFPTPSPAQREKGGPPRFFYNLQAVIFSDFNLFILFVTDKYFQECYCFQEPTVRIL